MSMLLLPQKKPSHCFKLLQPEGTLKLNVGEWIPLRGTIVKSFATLFVELSRRKYPTGRGMRPGKERRVEQWSRGLAPAFIPPSYPLHAIGCPL
ncbi:hypothetical protein C443_03134 [Haloarcula argentinensis DSM 12282]|nr:hypothetical protein C443_03134 [Haloarcula argentinensis DSM 12282]